MFCRNCGKEIPDRAKFCTHCGAAQTAARSSGPTQSHQQSPVSQPQGKPPKKKNNIFVMFAVILAATFVGQIIGKQMSKSYMEDADVGGPIVEYSQNEPWTEPANDNTGDETGNPKYTQIFSDRCIVHMPAMFFGQDYAAFAKDSEDGTIMNYEMGYKDDVITTLVQTLYMDISGLSDSEVQEMEAIVMKKFASVSELDFVTVDSYIGTNYYSVSCKTERLNEEAVMQEAIAYGVIELESSGDDVLMSMSRTESNLLADGFVKK